MWWMVLLWQWVLYALCARFNDGNLEAMRHYINEQSNFSTPSTHSVFHTYSIAHVVHIFRPLLSARAARH